MATPPGSPPPAAEPSECKSRKTRQATRLRSLTSRNLDQRRPTVQVNPQTRRGSGPHRNKFHSYLGVVAREKIPIIHETWKDVSENLKQLIWDDIMGKFDIPEPLQVRKKVMSSVATRWRQFKSSLTCRYIYGDKQGKDKALAVLKYALDPETWESFAASRENPNWQGVRKKAQEIQKFNDCPHVLSRGGYELLEKRLMEEKIEKRQQDAQYTKNPTLVDEPPSPIARHVKWKMARIKKFGRMTSTASQEIADRIDSLEEQTIQGSFIPHGRNDILNTALGRPEHPGRVRVAGTGVTIRQYFGQASRGSTSSLTSISQADLSELIKNMKEEWTRQQEQATEKAIEKKLQEVKDIMKEELKEVIKMELSQIASPPSPPGDLDCHQVVARVSTKESCADKAANASGGNHVTKVVPTMELLVVCDQSTKLVARGIVEHGVSTIHNVPYADDVVRVSVKEIIDGDAEVPIPSSEIKYMRETLCKDPQDWRG